MKLNNKDLLYMDKLELIVEALIGYKLENSHVWDTYRLHDAGWKKTSRNDDEADQVNWYRWEKK